MQEFGVYFPSGGHFTVIISFITRRMRKVMVNLTNIGPPMVLLTIHFRYCSGLRDIKVFIDLRMNIAKTD